MQKVRLTTMVFAVVLAVSAVAATSSSAHEWLKNGSALTKTEEVSYSGGELTLLSGTKSITCQKVAGTGNVSPGTMGLAKEIHLLECTAGGAPNCDPHSAGAANGLISIKDTLMELGLHETSGKEKIVADEIKPNATTKEFTTIEFTALTAGACESYPTTKVKGNINAAVTTLEELEFPSPELAGNTLEAFGKIAKLDGFFKQVLVGGGELQVVPRMIFNLAFAPAEYTTLNEEGTVTFTATVAGTVDQFARILPHRPVAVTAFKIESEPVTCKKAFLVNTTCQVKVKYLKPGAAPMYENYLDLHPSTYPENEFETAILKGK